MTKPEVGQVWEEVYDGTVCRHFIVLKIDLQSDRAFVTRINRATSRKMGPKSWIALRRLVDIGSKQVKRGYRYMGQKEDI